MWATLGMAAAKSIGGLINATSATKDKFLDKEQIRSLEKRQANLSKDVKTSRLAHAIGNNASNRTAVDLQETKSKLEQAKNLGEISEAAYNEQVAQLGQVRSQALAETVDSAEAKQTKVNDQRKQQIEEAENRIEALHEQARRQRDAARSAGFSQAIGGLGLAGGAIAGHYLSKGSGGGDGDGGDMSGLSSGELLDLINA